MRQHNRNRAVSPSLLLLAGLAFCVSEVLTGAQEKPANRSTEGYTPLQAEAKQTYESVCAACHGLDARGSERGPDIPSRPEIVLNGRGACADSGEWKTSRRDAIVSLLWGSPNCRRWSLTSEPCKAVARSWRCREILNEAGYSSLERQSVRSAIPSPAKAAFLRRISLPLRENWMGTNCEAKS